MILGLDLGNTLLYKHRDETLFQYRAVEAVNRLSPLFEKVCIVSKVNEEQEIRSREWIEKNELCNKLKISPVDIYYCRERKDKGVICKTLGITHFVDDRPEVMASLEKSVFKVLFYPSTQDVLTWFNKLDNCKIALRWSEVESLILANLQKYV